MFVFYTACAVCAYCFVKAGRMLARHRRLVRSGASRKAAVVSVVEAVGGVYYRIRFEGEAAKLEYHPPRGVRHRVGDELTVCYDPQKREDFVVKGESGLVRGAVFFFCIGLVVIAMGVASAVENYLRGQ